MTLSDDHLDDAIREALTGRESAAGAHPEPDGLLAYYEGDLDEAAAERVREHLVACEECAAVILDFEEFPDFEEPASVAPAAVSEPSRSYETLALPLAAIFLLAALGLGVWGWQLKHASEKPDGAIRVTTLTPLDPGDRGGSSAAEALDLADRRSVYLALTGADLSGEHTRYVLEVADRAGNVSLDDVSLERQGGTFIVRLPVSALDAGGSVLRVYGEGADGRELLGEYAVVGASDNG